MAALICAGMTACGEADSEALASAIEDTAAEKDGSTADADGVETDKDTGSESGGTDSSVNAVAGAASGDIGTESAVSHGNAVQAAENTVDGMLIVASEADDGEAAGFGLMYASVIDVNGTAGESSTVYSFKDKNDPDNAWSVNGLELGYIGTDLGDGEDVAILYNGDLSGDGEDLRFIAVLPDGDYKLCRAEGITVSNVMSTFIVKQGDGSEITFLKDNCVTDEDALVGDSGDHVIVYYADGGELGVYPMRIYGAD